jgi:hypothetical protein
VLQVIADVLTPVHRTIKELRLEVENFNSTILDGEPEGIVASSGNVLLIAILDAFKSILSVFIGAVLYLQSESEPDSNEQDHPEYDTVDRVGLISRLKPWADASGAFFRTARSQLIIEQGGDVHNVGLGPVVTPEAILLLTIRRLALGIWRRGSVDVVDLYAKCLEKLVKHAPILHLQ